jgi:RHS repeat-associated protein
VAESRHYPYGVERWSSGALPTDYRFTGQRFEAGLGIYVMGVRWYDPYINRFLSPDSIIPQPANPQSLNRFSYALGNPLRYRDPTGHWEEEWEEQFEQEHGRPATEQDWWDYQFSLQIENWIAACWEQTYQLRTLLWGAEVTIKAGDIKWTIAQAEVVGEAVQRIADRFDGNVRPFIGGLIVILKTNTDPWWAPLWRWWNKQPADFRFGGYEQGGKIYMRADNVNVGGLLHEMGHYYDEEDRLSRAYQKHVKQAGLDIQTNRFEDFANAFRDYVLGNLMAAARRDYFDQLRVQQDSE